MTTRRNKKKNAFLEFDPAQTWKSERIETILSHGENVVLGAPPGYGKAILVKKIAFNISEKNRDFQVCFMDLLTTSSGSVFLHQLRDEVLRFTNPGEFSRYKENTQEQELIELPEKVAKSKKFKLLICINNIQNIARFPESETFQTKLRFMNRKRENCVYFLYGHNIEALKSIFQTRYKALHNFGRLFTLKNPDIRNSKTKIKEYFFSSDKRITPEALNKINSTTYGHPFYTQLLAMHSCWRTQFICTEQIVQDSLEGIINILSHQFQILLDQLTIKQIHYMKALLYQAQGFCSKENLSIFELGRSSNVTRVRKSLEKKEIIQSFRGETFFIDPILEYWLANYYFDLPTYLYS